MLHTTTAVRMDENAPADELFTDSDSDTNSVNSIDNCCMHTLSVFTQKSARHHRIIYSKPDVYNGSVCALLKVLMADVIWLM